MKNVQKCRSELIDAARILKNVDEEMLRSLKTGPSKHNLEIDPKNPANLERLSIHQ